MRPFEISQTVSDQASVDLSGFSALLLRPVPAQRVLLDCPETAFVLRPFLLPCTTGQSDQCFLVPMPADTAPMAHMIRALLE